jgi:hypothetical protein
MIDNLQPSSLLAEKQEFLTVPRTVTSKYDVVTVNKSIEELIKEKIKEDLHDKEEAFYFVDLGAVVRKYQEWVKYLPRVKPFYGIERYFGFC